MKRAHEERPRTIHVWRQHLAWHGSDPLACVCEFQIGRFRKGQRVGGCGKARCYLCHGEKRCKRPTPQQRRADVSYKEWLHELYASEPIAVLGRRKQNESSVTERLTRLESGKLNHEGRQEQAVQDGPPNQGMQAKEAGLPEHWG
jgi:hypothetical protein